MGCLHHCSAYPSCSCGQGLGTPPAKITPTIQPDMRRWQTCPVCLGKGIVAGGFYNQPGPYGVGVDTAPEQCRSCGGRGIVR